MAMAKLNKPGYLVLFIVFLVLLFSKLAKAPIDWWVVMLPLIVGVLAYVIAIVITGIVSGIRDKEVTK